MASEVGGTSRDSPSRMKNRHALKKGPWTAAEDQLLQDYVKKHGEGNWNAVQRHSGLMRCGKSCRLRWANHLRPDLKKGAFSPEEEQLIVELHAKLGNKWARMAAQIPGRTDNEIKNYWNTRVKRRMRDGLPIYPHELVDQERRQPPPPQPQPPPPPQQQHHHQGSSSQTHSLSSLLALPANPFAFNRPMIRRSDDHQSRAHHAPYTSSQLKLYRDDNGGLALSLDASSSTFSSSSFFDHGVASQLPINQLVQYNFLDYGAPTSFGKEPSELPSIQSPPGTAAVGAPSASFHEFVVENLEVGGRNHSSLFEDLFGESGDEQFVAEGGHFNGDSSSHEGMEAKASEESLAAMDDELMNLLDNFPLSVPIPEWNGGDGRESPILNNGTSGAMHGQPEAPEYNPVAATSEAANQDSNFGSSLWNNMPTIQ